MDENTKKIVILNRLKSPYIEQAIFILREGQRESDAVKEAEKIVNEYLRDLDAAKRQKSSPSLKVNAPSKNKGSFLLFALVAIASISLALILYILTL